VNRDEKAVWFSLACFSVGAAIALGKAFLDAKDVEMAAMMSVIRVWVGDGLTTGTGTGEWTRAKTEEEAMRLFTAHEVRGVSISASHEELAKFMISRGLVPSTTVVRGDGPAKRLLMEHCFKLTELAQS